MKEQPMLYIDTATELDYIEARLKDVPEKIASKRILKTALTAAARQARKQLIKDNKQRYALKKSGTFSRESKIIAAKTSKLEATVLASGPKHKLYEFTSRQNTARLAARAKVLKESPLKALEVDNRKAFVATMERHISKKDQRPKSDCGARFTYSCGHVRPRCSKARGCRAGLRYACEGSRKAHREGA